MTEKELRVTAQYCDDISNLVSPYNTEHSMVYTLTKKVDVMLEAQALILRTLSEDK